MMKWTAAFSSDQLRTIFQLLFGPAVPGDLYIVAAQKMWNQDAIAFLGVTGKAEKGERWGPEDLQRVGTFNVDEITGRQIDWLKVQERLEGLIAAKAIIGMDEKEEL